MYTVKELREKCMTPQKVASDKKELFVFYFLRPIAYVLTIPFLQLGILPNTVTLISFFPSIIGFLLLGFGESVALKTAGAFCFLLWGLLDCIDGNIARFRNLTSKLGELWDAAAGYTAMALIYLAMGVAAYTTPHEIFTITQISRFVYIVLGALTSILALLPRVVMHKRVVLFSAESAIGLSNKKDLNLLRTIALNLLAGAGFILLFVIVAVLAGLIHLFVLGYFALNLLMAFVSLRQLLKE